MYTGIAVCILVLPDRSALGLFLRNKLQICSSEKSTWCFEWLTVLWFQGSYSVALISLQLIELCPSFLLPAVNCWKQCVVRIGKHLWCMKGGYEFICNVNWLSFRCVAIIVTFFEFAWLFNKMACCKWVFSQKMHGYNSVLYRNNVSSMGSQNQIPEEAILTESLSCILS